MKPSPEPSMWSVATAARIHNLRTQFERILKRAGLRPWERLFPQSARQPRETELTEHFPLHVVCDWIGNSAVIASKHYLQLTEAHFTKAVAWPGGGERPGQSHLPAGSADGGAKAAQNAAQFSAARGSH